jgi:PPOX class probable F420-dependent enzyme
MSVSLPQSVRELLDKPTYAVLTTLNPDGSPHSTVIWLKRDGDDIVFSTARGRRKARNMERDPRISICAYDPARPFFYCSLEGTVTLTEDDGPELIDELSRKYDVKPRNDQAAVTRLACRLTPARVISN